MKPRIYYSVFKILIGLSLVFFLSEAAIAQEQKVSDSLKKIYVKGRFKGNERLELLRNLAFNEVENIGLSLSYADELIRLSSAEKNYLYLHRGYYQKGNKYRLIGELGKSLDAFFKSSEAAVKAKYLAGEGTSYASIADVYSVLENTKNAENYYTKAISLLRKTDNSISLGSVLLNAGEEYYKNKKYDIALTYFRESGEIFKKNDYLIGTAYNLGNIGRVYAEQGKEALAMENMNKAFVILDEFKDYYAISDYQIAMSDIYLKRNDWQKALAYASQSLELAKKYGLKSQASISNLKLSVIYEKLGKSTASLKFFKDHIAYRDSVNNLETVQKIADLRTDFEVSQKQAEVDLLSQQKKNQRIVVFATVIALGCIAFVAFGLYRRNKFIKKTNKIIETERKRSDDLLLNILPEKTAEELKLNGKVEAKRFQSVTILFTDFHGFTQYAENLTPEQLVESVDFYFSKFDEIIEKYNLEKIKTIGDAYMCAGGLPFPTEDHAINTVKAAIEIAAFVEETRKSNNFKNTSFEIRLGINTGPVVAGVVGIKKFAYDIWGDAVNVASRLEANSESGKINISESTYELIKDTYDCQYRGEIDVKNKGLLKMYFVNATSKVKKTKTVTSSLLQTTI